MDALKIIAAESVKEQAPQFSVGDTVRVSVNIREGERERESSSSRARSSPARVPASAKPSLSAVFPTASAWREFSRCIPRT